VCTTIVDYLMSLRASKRSIRQSRTTAACWWRFAQQKRTHTCRRCTCRVS